MLRLAVHAVDESQAVLRLLPEAQALQFDRSAVRPENETGRKAQGGHGDPTSDLALDAGRLYLREVLARCEPHLTAAVTALGGMRRGLERALSSWQDDPHT